MFRAFLKDLVIQEFVHIPRNVTALLFISGFALLGLQVVGIRVLGPYVGTAIPVWATVIGMMLVGGALGYYLGGYIADTRRSPRAFRLLWLVAGISIGVIPFTRGIVPILSESFSPALTLLFSAKVLFLVPSMALSALTTYLIRTYVSTLAHVGQMHGDLYTIATIGSITGVFGTSYVLIPHVTVPHMLFGFAILVMLVGFLSESSHT